MDDILRSLVNIRHRNSTHIETEFFKYQPIEDIIKKKNSRYFFARVIPKDTSRHNWYSHALVLELSNTNGKKSYSTIAPVELFENGTKVEKIKIYLFKKNITEEDKKITSLIELLLEKYPHAEDNIFLDLWRNR